jgi:hypothetical protein
MAYIWHLTISCANEAFARDIADRFDKTTFKLPHAGLCEPRLGVKRESTGWEIHVCPYVEQNEHGGPWHLNGHGGASTPEEAEDIDACAREFYERLSNHGGGTRFNYHFALTGFEVGEWRSVGGLLDDLSEGGLFREMHGKGGHGWDGLVVSQALYQLAQSPEGFSQFLGGAYFWVPYTSITLSQ